MGKSPEREAAVLTKVELHQSSRGVTTCWAVSAALDSLCTERREGSAFLTHSYTRHFETMLLQRKKTARSHVLSKERKWVPQGQ